MKLRYMFLLAYFSAMNTIGRANSAKSEVMFCVKFRPIDEEVL